MDSRAAVAERLQSLFDRQTESLQEYLRLIEAQGRSLRDGNAARFEAQLEAERALLDRLVVLRRASDGLERAYREAHPAGEQVAETSRALAAAAAAAVARSADGRRAALTARQAEIGRELRAIARSLARTPSLAGSPGPGPGPDAGGIVDVSR